MIVIRFSGGIGNQLYQYAMYHVLSEIYPTIDIKADTSLYYLLDEHDGFLINKWFDENIPLAGYEEIESICCAFTGRKWMGKIPTGMRTWLAFHSGRLTKVKEKISNRGKKNHVIGIGDCYVYNDLLYCLNTEQSWYLSGLYQNWQYFEKYEQILKNKISYRLGFPTEYQKLLSDIRNMASVSIHIRRGDFVGGSLDICSRSYYERAMVEAEHKMGKVDKWFFFSDDPSFVNETYPYIENKEIILHGGGKKHI